MSKVSTQQRVKPMILRDKNTNDAKYELDFTRETIRFAENRGFDIADLSRFPMTKVPEIFFYAFRKNHKNVARSQTDAILYDELQGLKPEYLERLVQLYTQPYEAIIINDEEDGDAGKNATVTVEL